MLDLTRASILVISLLLAACHATSSPEPKPRAHAASSGAGASGSGGQLAGAGGGHDGGSGGGNPATEHFYVTNTEGQSLSVIDHASLSVIDTIQLNAKPHGQAPTSDGTRIYVTTDGGSGEVIAIDSTSRQILWRIAAGSRLNEPHLTRDETQLYAPDLLAARTVIVDVTQGKVDGEIAMFDGILPMLGLHNTYASHDGSFMYVTSILSEKIAAIDPATREIERVYDLTGQPRPAAITADDGTMYVQLSELHGFTVLDLGSGEQTATIEWPEPTTTPPGYDQLTLPTKCHGIGIRPDGSEVWAASNLEGNVRVYSLPDHQELAVIEVGTLPNWIAFTSDGSFAYVTNTDVAAAHGTVSVIDANTRQVVKTIDVGAAPKRIHRVAHAHGTK